MSPSLNQPSSSALGRAGVYVSLAAIALSCVISGLAQGADDLAPLPIKLPPAQFEGTKKDVQVGPNVEPQSDKPRPPFMAPKDVKNVAFQKKVTSSDNHAAASNLQKITDGDKAGESPAIILLRKGTQYAQIDLAANYEIFAVVIWHAHDAPKVYHDVVVQVADDADFIENVRTLFNNDIDNSSGLGVGTDREYFESNQGKLIDAKRAKAQFVRCYSRGSTESAQNEYTEIEVYGRPVK